MRNDGYTDFPLVMEFIKKSRKSTVNGKPLSLEQRFASKVRTLTRAIDEDMAKEVERIYVTVHLVFAGDSKWRLIFLCTLVWTIAGSV